MQRFTDLIQTKFDKSVDSYDKLHEWSVQHPEDFWEQCWRFVDMKGTMGARRLISKDRMMDASFFPDSRMNFAETCLQRDDSEEAIIFQAEDHMSRSVSWKELRGRVSVMTSALRNEGVVKGDRVCAVVANTPEVIICMLAVASLGAIWSSVSADFGVSGIVERYAQVSPKVLLHHDCYYVKGRRHDLRETIKGVMDQIGSTVQRCVHIPFSGQQGSLRIKANLKGVRDISLGELASLGDPASVLQFEPTTFNDPLFIMFSSGTTGKPKCIVHRHGVLLQLMKEHQLHCDIRPRDRVFYYTTCTWMMWNWLVSALASRATVMLYEGNPFYPQPLSLFEWFARHKGTFFGVSAKYIDHLRGLQAHGKMGALPPLPTMRMIASTGSPLVAESFDFVYAHIKRDVHLISICGGTDLLSCFILGSPTKPVRRGCVSAIGLGMDVQVWDPDTGARVWDTKGELVCCTPFPSQPLGFFGDDGAKSAYRAAYFDTWPNVWKHGDFVSVSRAHQGVVVYGRSDATLKPGGVRIGTAEIYRAVEQLPFVQESVCVGIAVKPGEEVVGLFVILRDPSARLTDDHRAQIRSAVERQATRHHVPRVIEQVTDIPRTKSGKITELAIRNVLHGWPVKNVNALANPEALREFEQYRLAHALP